MSEPITIGRATLYLGDCRDILPTLGKVDAVVTDPPYGLGEASGGQGGPRGVRAPARDYGNHSWDDETIDAELLARVLASGHSKIIFGGNYYALPPSRCWLVWDKVNGANDFADCELAWTNLSMAVRRICWQWHGFIRQGEQSRTHYKERLHPTQKPLAVMKWGLGFLPNAQSIIDPFMGSGTTGVAAIQMGKSFVGIERDPSYFEVAVRRIREANGDDAGPLFGEAA